LGSICPCARESRCPYTETVVGSEAARISPRLGGLRRPQPLGRIEVTVQGSQASGAGGTMADELGTDLEPQPGCGLELELDLVALKARDRVFC
jgi:hypothetical protein